MSFQIGRGLFKFDFTDYYAILGIPVDADEKVVRKRYLKIARNLHPDSCKAESAAEKKLANELLSKLVNPAYEQLSRGHREYFVSLGHIGKRLAAEKGKISLTSETAKRLTQAGASLDSTYKSTVQNLASNQYESLDQVLDKIAEISEVNLVYLMLKGSKGETLKTAGGATTTSTSTGSRTTTSTGTSGRTTVPMGTGGRTTASTGVGGLPGDADDRLSDSYVKSRVSEYIRRAEGYMAKNNFAGAVLELREALKLEQNNSRSHTLLGIAFLKQNQATMAKVHLNKALQLNPKDEMALKGKMYLEKLAEKNPGAKPSVSSKPASGNPSDKSGGGGLFGGLFGGKKK